jgi:hypothetical protein
VVTTAVNHVIASSSVPLFEYFGANYTGSGDPLGMPVDLTSIRLVKVTLQADINPEKAPIPVFFSETINLRNLRSN